MYTAKILLTSIKNKDLEAANDSLNYLLGAWRMNGQILGREFPIAHAKNSIESYVNIPDSDSLSDKYNNKYVSKAFSEMQEKKLPKPQVIVLGKEPDSAILCNCKKITSFILFTTYISLESPLRCADCFGVIPLYKIPKTDGEEYHNIISWQSDYQSCDSLQMGCLVGARFALNQLFKYDSQLTKFGLHVCQSIEEVTNKKVFYYLYKYSAKSEESENLRKCPNCGGDWRLKEPLHNLFDFQCKKCFLLSNVAFSLR